MGFASLYSAASPKGEVGYSSLTTGTSGLAKIGPISKYFVAV